jgi:hypothetical protein
MTTEGTPWFYQFYLGISHLTMLLIIQHLKSYSISFGSVIAQPPGHSPIRSGNPEGRLDWAIQKKELDYPVKPDNDKLGTRFDMVL